MRGEPECLLELTGQDLMGVPLSSPNCPHERVYVLPLLTILTNKVGSAGRERARKHAGELEGYPFHPSSWILRSAGPRIS